MRKTTQTSKTGPVPLIKSSGLTATDYLLADRWQVEDGGEAHCPEKVLRLPDGYVCFDPPADAPEVGPLPALLRGQVTFGSFNNPAKITPCVVAAWAEILRRVPGSRLVLKFGGFDQGGTRRHYEGLFAAGGMGPERLELLGWSLRARMLEEYNRLDLVLDPFPYSGGITTCEALWMGVPVITLPGWFPYDTVVYLGCHYASGLTQDYDIVNAVWNQAFSGLNVKTKSGTPLTYYASYVPSGTNDTTSLLSTGDGRCGAWSHLLRDVLTAQGLSPTLVEIVPNNGSQGFLINNWQFGSPNASTVVASVAGMSATDLAALESQYGYVDVVQGAGTFNAGDIYNASKTGYNFSYADVTDLLGASGQNNGNPASLFPDHEVVSYTYSTGETFWFDPSYGNVYTGSTDTDRLSAFQTQCVAGFFKYDDYAYVKQSYLGGGDNGTGQLQRTVLFIEPNTGGPQLTWTTGY